MQIRMSKALVEKVDRMVKTGNYSSRGDVIRDCVRRLVWDREVGTINMNTDKDSVTLVREARKKLSQLPIDLDEINNIGLRK